MPIVETRQWDGTNADELRKWLGDAFVGKCFGILTIETFAGRQAVYIGEWIEMDLEDGFVIKVQTRRDSDNFKRGI